jgi:hypothetical protein
MLLMVASFGRLFNGLVVWFSEDFSVANQQKLSGILTEVNQQLV